MIFRWALVLGGFVLLLPAMGLASQTKGELHRKLCVALLDGMPAAKQTALLVSMLQETAGSQESQPRELQAVAEVIRESEYNEHPVTGALEVLRLLGAHPRLSFEGRDAVVKALLAGMTFNPGYRTESALLLLGDFMREGTTLENISGSLAAIKGLISREQLRPQLLTVLELIVDKLSSGAFSSVADFQRQSRSVLIDSFELLLKIGPGLETEKRLTSQIYAKLSQLEVSIDVFHEVLNGFEKQSPSFSSERFFMHVETALSQPGLPPKSLGLLAGLVQKFARSMSGNEEQFMGMRQKLLAVRDQLLTRFGAGRNDSALESVYLLSSLLTPEMSAKDLFFFSSHVSETSAVFDALVSRAASELIAGNFEFGRELILQLEGRLPAATLSALMQALAPYANAAESEGQYLKTITFVLRDLVLWPGEARKVLGQLGPKHINHLLSDPALYDPSLVHARVLGVLAYDSMDKEQPYDPAPIFEALAKRLDLREETRLQLALLLPRHVARIAASSLQKIVGSLLSAGLPSSQAVSASVIALGTLYKRLIQEHASGSKEFTRSRAFLMAALRKVVSSQYVLGTDLSEVTRIIFKLNETEPEGQFDVSLLGAIVAHPNCIDGNWQFIGRFATFAKYPLQPGLDIVLKAIRTRDSNYVRSLLKVRQEEWEQHRDDFLKQ